MFARLWIIALAAFFFYGAAGWHAQAAPAERRVALVIGNAAYRNGSPLANPVNDSRAMAASLKRAGFEVIQRENATKSEMDLAVLEFSRRLGADGVGLFYFSGHGIQVGGKNYLIPVDMDGAVAEAQVRLVSTDVDAVIDQMAAARGRLNIVILDACRNNPFERRFRSAAGGLASIDAPKGTLIAYATAPGKVASDGAAGGYGLYTGELLRAMTVPGLRIEDVFKRVRSEVSRASNDSQIPWESSALTGDFFFMPGTAPAGTAPASTAAASPEESLWELVRDSTNPAIVEEYLRRFPRGAHAEAARQRIDQLKRTQTAALPPAPSSTPSAKFAAPSGPDLVIGVAVPPRGRLIAPSVDQILRGVERAVADVNAAGGVLGRRLVVETVDEGCTRERGTAAANALVAKRAALAIGHLCTSVVGYPIYGEAKIVFMSLAAGPSTFTDNAAARGWKSIFRMNSRHDVEGAAAGEYVARSFGGKRVAIVYDDTLNGEERGKGAERAILGAGRNAVARLALVEGRVDDVIRQLRSDRTEVVYFSGSHDAAADFLKRMRGAGITAAFIGDKALTYGNYWGLAGTAADGTLMALPADPRNNAAARDAVARFRAAGQEPEGYVLYAYAAVQVFAAAAERSRTVAGDEVARALHDGSYDSVLGRVSFDAKGDLANPPQMTMHIWRNGSYSPM